MKTAAAGSKKQVKPRFVASLALAAATAGCMVGVDYKKPALDTPAKFSEGHTGPTTQPVAMVNP